MKDLDATVFIAVFEEMLGFWFWAWAATTLVAVTLCLWVILRDGGLRARRLVWSEAAALAGGIAAIWIMQEVTHSGFRDIGGPVDWVLGIAIFAVGASAAGVAVYAMAGLMRRLA